jgi:hypothetical protein
MSIATSAMDHRRSAGNVAQASGLLPIKKKNWFSRDI